jgi:hypothetical protein
VLKLAASEIKGAGVDRTSRRWFFVNRRTKKSNHWKKSCSVVEGKAGS